MVGICGIRRCRRTPLGLVVRIAQRRTFQEGLRQELAPLGFARLVVLVIADAEVQVLHIGFIALGLGIVPQLIFFAIRLHGKIAFEHVARQVRETALFKNHVVRRLHVGALRRTVVAQRHRDMIA